MIIDVLKYPIKIPIGTFISSRLPVQRYRNYVEESIETGHDIIYSDKMEAIILVEDIYGIIVEHITLAYVSDDPLEDTLKGYVLPVATKMSRGSTATLHRYPNNIARIVTTGHWDSVQDILLTELFEFARLSTDAGITETIDNKYAALRHRCKQLAFGNDAMNDHILVNMDRVIDGLTCTRPIIQPDVVIEDMFNMYSPVLSVFDAMTEFFTNSGIVHMEHDIEPYRNRTIVDGPIRCMLPKPVKLFDPDDNTVYSIIDMEGRGAFHTLQNYIEMLPYTDLSVRVENGKTTISASSIYRNEPPINMMKMHLPYGHNVEDDIESPGSKVPAMITALLRIIASRFQGCSTDVKLVKNYTGELFIEIRTPMGQLIRIYSNLNLFSLMTRSVIDGHQAQTFTATFDWDMINRYKFLLYS